MPDQFLALNQMFSDHNLAFQGMGDDGQPIVKDGSGKQFSFPVDKFLSDNGLKKEDVQVQYNDSDHPLPYTPIEAFDRLKLSLSGASQAAHDDAMKNWSLKHGYGVASSDQGLVIDKDGVHYLADPSMFGQADPWKLAKGIAKMVVPMYGTAGEGLSDVSGELGKAYQGAKATLQSPDPLGQIAGDIYSSTPAIVKTIGQAAGVAAGSVGGPAGEIAGAGVGGLAASKVLTSLGRVIGTYNATPEQELAENAIDGILSMGGQTVAIGMRPVARMFNDAISDISEKATDNVKGGLAKIFSTATGVKDSSSKFIFNQPDLFSAEQEAIHNAVGSGEKDVIQEAAQRNLGRGQEILTGARQQLTAQYGAGLKGLFNAAEEKGATLDMGNVLQPVHDAIDSLGIGTIESTASGSKIFRPYSTKDVIAAERNGFTGLNSLPDELVKPVSQMVNEVLGRADLGKVNGKAAAEILTKLDRKVGDIADSQISEGLQDALDHVVKTVRNGVKTGIGDVMDSAGLNKEYTQLSSLYQTNKDAVDWGMKAVNREGGTEAFLKKLTDSTGRFAEAKGYADKLIQLNGERGETLYNQILAAQAVGDTAPWFHKGLVGAVAQAGGTVGLMFGAHVNPAIALPIATQMSPRIATTEVMATRKLLQTLHGLGPQQLSSLIQNDQLFDAAIRPVISAGPMEKAVKNTLLQSSGVGSGGQ